MKLSFLTKIFVSKKTDFTTGNIGKKLLTFAIPVILQAFLQIFFAAFDMLVVSYYGSGQAALAAMGNSLNLINLIVNMFTGISGAVAVLFAITHSKKDQLGNQRLIGISLFLGLVIGLVGLIICVSCARYILLAINTPLDIIDAAVSHFRCYFVVFPFMMLTNFFISILFAVGDSRSALYNIIIRSILQTSLTCLFVVAFKMDILGVGIATAIAVFLQCVHGFYVIFLSKNRIQKFSFKLIRFYKDEFISILKVGVLIGGARFLISFANTSLQYEIGSFGSVVLAGCSVAGLFFALVFNVMDAVGSACMVAASQNFGVGNHLNNKKIIKFGILIVFGVYMLVAIPILATSPYLMSFFLNESLPHERGEITIAWNAGMIKALLLIGFSFIYGIMQCLYNVFNGLKRQYIPLINSFLTSLVFRLIFGIVLTASFDTYNATDFTLLISSVPISWLLSVLLSWAILRIMFRRFNAGAFESKDRKIFNSVYVKFLEQVKKTPSNIAVVDNHSKFTYQELNDEVNKLAKVLLANKVKKHDRVVVYLPHNKEIEVAALAIWLVGAIYVPVDQIFPIERLNYIINNTESKVIISVSSLKLNYKKKRIINLDKIKNVPNRKLKYHAIYNIDPAAILYTSGTSGNPKGVVLSHETILNSGDWRLVTKTPLNSKDYVCVTCNFSTGPALPFLFLPLKVGATVDIISIELRNNISQFYKYLLDKHATDCYLPTNLAIYLFENFKVNNINVIMAGEKPYPFKNKSPIPLINIYGATECMFISGAKVYGNEKLLPSGEYNYGDIIILDENLKEVEDGNAGELFFYAPTIQTRYYKLEDEEKKKYIEINHKRYYRSGDLAKRINNTIYIIGRKGEGMVKINGNRVEINEVETALMRVNLNLKEEDRFDNAVCVAKEKDNKNYLCCYYEGRTAINEAKIKEELAKGLPSFMIPSFFIHLDRLPRNTNGKILKGYLPNIDIDKTRARYESPKDDYEKKVCDAFTHALNISPIGVNDDFVQLGGDSLTAIKSIIAIDNANITSVDVLSLRTPKKIAAKMKNLTTEKIYSDTYLDKKDIPLNEQQLNIYLDIITHEKMTAYLIPVSTEINNAYSIEKIKEAVINLIHIHPLLASHIILKNGKPFIHLDNNVEITYKECDKQWVMNNFYQQYFDINKSLSRFLICKDENNRIILYASFHHLIFDGLSLAVFRDDLFALLKGEKLEKDLDFFYSASFTEKIKKMPIYKEAEEFFKKEFSNVKDLPEFMPDLFTNFGSFQYYFLSVDRNMLEEFIKKNNLTKGIFFTAVFAYTLSRFTASNYSYFCMIENGRDRLKGTRGIGMFANTLPICVNCENKTIVEYLNECKELILNTFSYNFYPFRVLSKDFNLSANILFQYQPNIDAFMRQISTEDRRFFFHKRKDFVADLDFFLNENDTTLVLNVSHSNKYNPRTLQRFLATYAKILLEFLSKKELKDIDYISIKDRILFNQINSTKSPLEHNDVIEAFTDMVNKRPNNVCITYKNKHLTYKEASSLANAIKRNLNKVKKDSSIAIWLERSQYFMITALAVLSSNYIYVPLDDNFPDARILFILEDSNAEAILVSNKTIKRASEIIKQANKNITLINIEDVKGDNKLLKKVKIDPNKTSCILYTSGTTGNPKGNLVTHRALVNMGEWYAKSRKLNEKDVYAMYTVPTFDMHTIAYYAPMMVGASIDVVPEEIRLDLHKLNNYFIKHKVTHTFLPTQIGKLFTKLKLSTSLKVLEVAGEKLGQFESPKGFEVYDVYGPTESIVVTSINCKEKIHPSSVGDFTNNIQGYILDSEKRQVPFGAPGELYLTGYQLSNGYLNRAQENEKSFIDNPFNSDNDHSSKLYKTGDIVRFLPDASLAIIGRKDGQVKIRGNRVELKEVEASIQEIEIINEVTVQTILNGDNNELIAYVTSTSKNDALVKKTVIDYVKKHKPSFMVPTHVKLLNKIPLNNNGKVDKRVLPQVNNLDLNKEIIPPRNKTEIAIVNAFKKIFKTNEISIKDDFVTLGGDSILAVSLLSLLQQSDINLKISHILKGESIENLSKIASNAFLNKKQDIYVYNKRNKTKIFMVHTMNAGSELYYRLADRLKNDYALAVFEQYNLNHPDNQIISIEGISEKYIELMKKVQPKGPYCIGGWSYGATIAFAMANILEKRKETVKLILLDPSLYTNKKIQNLIISDISLTIKDYLLNDPLFKDTKKSLDLNALINNSLIMTPVWLKYKPNKYNGSLLFFRSAKLENNPTKTKKLMFKVSQNSVAGGYEHYINRKEMKLINLSCAHDNMLDEGYVDIIAKGIKDYLK